MALKKFDIKHRIAVGGRSSGEEFTVNYQVLTNTVPYTTEFRTKMTAGATAIKNAILSTGEVIHSGAQDLDWVQGGGKGRPLPISLDHKGLVGAVAATPATQASLDRVAAFKKDVMAGQAGSLFLRCCFLEAELDADSTGKLILLNNAVPARITTFATALLNAWKVGDGDNMTEGLILPQRTSAKPRLVFAMSFDQVSTRQTTVKRESGKVALNRALRSLMVEISRDYLDAKFSDSQGTENTLSTEQKAEFNARRTAVISRSSIAELGKIGYPKGTSEFWTKGAS